MSDRDTLDLEADDGTTSEELEPWRAARMFTLVHITPYDSYVAGWDSKYHWDFWRPYTAIRAGDTDGNRRTVKDGTWQSYLETPPVQDYPSTRSTLAAGAAEVLKRSFRTDRVPFSMESSTALPANPVRSFNTFTQAANENADSRVRAGIHFRFATEQGKALGARWAVTSSTTISSIADGETAAVPTSCIDQIPPST